MRVQWRFQALAGLALTLLTVVTPTLAAAQRADAQAPAARSFSLRASAVSPTTIELTWSEPSRGGVYDNYRHRTPGDGRGDWHYVATVTNGNRYLHTGLTLDTRYQYVMGNGTSNVANARTPRAGTSVQPSP